METIEALGKYEIKRTLGRGAMGVVYEGWDPIIARRVAIKTVKLPDEADPETEDALARFRREAQAAGRLTHPNIVAVFDYGETSDLAYIVMEFVDGPPLKTLLDKNERFALADAVRVMHDLLAGLQFSHERGVVHRDIKPANVMLTSTGQAKIADFGIARIESSSMTQAGTLLGTPSYMSPEQFMGQVVDARTDIYSAGVLLYQLLTGERPFEGSMSAIMHKALNIEPPAPSQLSVTAPPSFDAVVRRAMAKRPEDRFASAKMFAEAMQTALANQAESAVSEGETTLVAPPPTPSPAPPAPPPAPPAAAVAPVVVPAAGARSPSNVPAFAAAAVAALVVAGGGTWWFLSRPPVPPAPITPTQPMTSIATPPPSAAPTGKTPQQQAAPPFKSETTPPKPEGTSVAEPAHASADTPKSPTAQPPVQPPSSATTQPERPQVAMAGPDALRSQIAQWVSSRSCAMLGGNVGDNGTVTLSGLAGHGSIEELRQGLAGFVPPPGQVDWRVVGVNRVFCPALTTLHAISPPFGATGVSRLVLQMDGKTRLHDGEAVRMRLTMPDFPAWLRVDYLGHDGSVQHLYPQLADPKAGIVADPPRTFRAGEAIPLANPSWLIGPPYGTDIIIGVASSEPLFDRPRPSNSETADVYLRDLQSAVDNLRPRGARLAGSAVTLEALP
jgi:eukaryotic-like serine/threonine-protein kinase